jgi:hypothetical protein
MNKKPKVTAAVRAANAKAAQTAVEFAAMKGSESRRLVIDAVKAALGKVLPNSDKPADKALFALTRHSFQSGHMADVLFAGSNLPASEQLAKARLARDAADGEGKGNLKKGQTRRRTKPEQAAYNSAKTAWSRLLSDAGLKTSEKRGGNVAPKKGATPAKGAPVKGATVSAAEAAKYMPPKSADKETAVAYVRQQMKLLSTFIEAANQRAMKASSETLPIAICSAVEDCRKAIDAVK